MMKFNSEKMILAFLLSGVVSNFCIGQALSKEAAKPILVQMGDQSDKPTDTDELASDELRELLISGDHDEAMKKLEKKDSSGVVSSKRPTEKLARQGYPVVVEKKKKN